MKARTEFERATWFVGFWVVLTVLLFLVAVYVILTTEPSVSGGVVTILAMISLAGVDYSVGRRRRKRVSR